MTTIQTPEWVKNAVFYQIFPDRFARSERIKHPRGISFKPWGSDPTEQGYQGGDLYGVIDKLDYLKDLGITAIYLNPIFSSASNHRYHAYDYFEVDPLLGGDDALRELLDEAHKREIKIVLDGVFNHASRGFWQFHHILENGKNSPYLDWFIIKDWPLRPYSYTEDNPANYESWWNIPALPKLNTDNPGVRDFLFEVTRYWLEFGIDGWRLDVPIEIDDDEFWREFRQIVKSTNPEAYIVGEIWSKAQRWLQGDMFDAVMNYIFTGNTLNFFGAETLRSEEFKHPELPLKPLSAEAFSDAIDAMHGLYDWEINHAQLNLLDSHDMPRALWLVGEDKSALKLSVLFQMTMPGAPCIYYGSEIGMSAAGDPHCREAFPWNRPESWDQELLTFYKQATTLRHQHPVLRTGSFKGLYAQDDVYVFHRSLPNQQAVVAFNAGTDKAQISVQASGFTNGLQAVWALGGGSFSNEGGQLILNLPPREALILIG
jgi:neopullulanase